MNMKTITNVFKAIAFLVVLLGVKNSNAQCSASFSYDLTANGQVLFAGSASTSSLTTVFYWNYGNSATFTGTGTAGMYPNYTYTANGTYVVTLFIMNASPSCSTQTQQTITITNATNTCNINANFTYNQSNNGLISFNNTSTGTVTGVTYTWNFGDNTSPSTNVSPVHTYSANGTYIATLTANNNLSVSCVSTKTLAVVVNQYCTFAASFTYAVTGGNVSFNSTTSSSLGVSYNWNFGNSSSSNLANPVTTYTANGNYLVTLYAVSSSQTNCPVTYTLMVNITNAATCNINANYSYSQASNGLVNFNNLSTGTISGVTYNWAFGDNTSNVSTTSPAHTYSANGAYVATLTANNNMTPTCVSTKTLLINVTSYCTLSASFSYSQGVNGSVSFVNTSTGTGANTIYNWNFGDASTSTAANPTHTYFNGTYTVTLVATNFSVFPACSSTVTQVVTVTSNTCVANAAFSLTPTSTPKYWNANPAASSGIAAAQWSWGDGGTSSTLYTSHLYSVAATYTICLSVTLTCGASASYCSPYYIYRSSSANTNDDIIRVDVLDPATVGLKNSFTDNKELGVFPNPSTGYFKLSMESVNTEKVKVTVYNLMGAKLSESLCETANGKLEKLLDMHTEKEGVYFVEVITPTTVYTKKIVLSRD